MPQDSDTLIDDAGQGSEATDQSLAQGTVVQLDKLTVYFVLNSLPGGTQDAESSNNGAVDTDLLTFSMAVNETEIAKIPGWMERLNALAVTLQQGETETYRRVFPVLR